MHNEPWFQSACIYRLYLASMAFSLAALWSMTWVKQKQIRNLRLLLPKWEGKSIFGLLWLSICFRFSIHDACCRIAVVFVIVALKGVGKPHHRKLLVHFPPIPDTLIAVSTELSCRKMGSSFPHLARILHTELLQHRLSCRICLWRNQQSLLARL
jgi:hypothetical protein